MGEVLPQENPQEPLYYIPLSKGRAKLTIKQRLDLLRQELHKLELKYSLPEEVCEVGDRQVSSIASLST